MSDEEKIVEKKVCKHGCELGRFFTLTASIFLGVLLAILVAAALLKPNCPVRGRMMPPPPVMERQIPPMGQFAPPAQGGPQHFRGHGQRPDAGHPDFGQMPPAPIEKAPAKK